MSDVEKYPKPYVGKWTCDVCGHTSDNEHDPCNCDEDCCAHVETIASVRSLLAVTSAERDEARSGYAALLVAENKALSELEQANRNRRCAENERDAVRIDRTEIDSLSALLATAVAERDGLRDKLRVCEEQNDALGDANVAHVDLARLRAFEARHGLTLESIEAPNMAWFESSAVERIKGERDAAVRELNELIDATILGPLKGKTMHDALIEARTALATATARAEEFGGNAERFRSSMYALETRVLEVTRERDQAAATEREKWTTWLESLTEDSALPRRDFGCQNERIEPVAKMLATAIRHHAAQAKREG